MTSAVAPTPGAKMIYLIKRRPTASREELVVNWFANHMPAVIAGQHAQRERGRLHAWRYIATLFDAQRDGTHPWDGMAQLYFDEVVPAPPVPHGTEPADTFQQKAEPYSPWATTEYVVIDGAGAPALEVRPNTLNDPFPCTRSGYLKVTFLVGAQDGIDHDAFHRHWLEVHVPNVRDVMGRVGGLRYVVSHSVEPGTAPYGGMAELWFPDAEVFKAFNATIEPDGMERFTRADRTLVLRSSTEMIGIP